MESDNESAAPTIQELTKRHQKRDEFENETKRRQEQQSVSPSAKTWLRNRVMGAELPGFRSKSASQRSQQPARGVALKLRPLEVKCVKIT